jgi:centromere-localized protein 2
MAPSESSIVRNFLLSPAPLPVALPFDQFKDLFPTSLQANPEVVALYRELQHQRAIDMDDVKRNIETEARKGELQQREVLRARKKSQQAEMKDIDQRELVMEAEVFSLSYVHRFKLTTCSALQAVYQNVITSAA